MYNEFNTTLELNKKKSNDKLSFHLYRHKSVQLCLQSDFYYIRLNGGCPGTKTPAESPLTDGTHIPWRRRWRPHVQLQQRVRAP
jgi:hypothetical protein